ncbi:hypothetical protein HS125_06775 [bacterium]|nr:hypothetical protein [bacterium]
MYSGAVSVVLGLLLLGVLPASSTGAEPSSASGELPASVDLRPKFRQWDLTPRSQGKRPTCGTFATVNVLEYELAAYLGEGTRLSVEFLNWAKITISGATRDGGYFSHMQKGWEAYGACPEVMYPYRGKLDRDLRPPEEAIAAARRYRDLPVKFHWIRPHTKQPGLTPEQFHEVKRVLAEGHPVAAGSNHSRTLVGYRDDSGQPGGGVFFTNDSLKGGFFGEVTYEFVRTKLYDAFWVGVGNVESQGAPVVLQRRKERAGEAPAQ